MDDVEAMAALRDPVRRRLYEYVSAQDHEVGRNEAAEAVGVQRTLAAHHLDRLAEAGLLETTSRRLSGRSGPGAGRPAKLYRRAAGERTVSLPPRDYRTAAELLAEAAEESGLDEPLHRAARSRGRQLAERAGPVGDLEAARALLAARGYEPVVEETPGGAVLRMRNCPFHALSEEFPPLVCGMNLALLEGLFENAPGLAPRMDPRPGWCCTVLGASKNNER
ncbi:helix-turn-helix transcriptional regulator [Thermomonospora cellulosilytica]|uniref:Putative ArsR family transcriptional regulator n=1 Tax=Thermomonospora cellulosilytica TaxID=1411118 RepID=A0A7W3N1X8_9ACTN|nr:transcriptional regulator [Thermomonospora cellulosilytica]MBA9006035.1 putative ArsR family transcriptional regulator [Thermomonospora cellulosilytica]